MTQPAALRAVPVSPSIFARREVGRRSNSFAPAGDYRVKPSTVRLGMHRRGYSKGMDHPVRSRGEESLRPTSGFALTSASSEVGASPALSKALTRSLRISRHGIAADDPLDLARPSDRR